jgi:guanine deaminase
MTDAIQVSKLNWRMVDQSAKQLTFPEAFYMGTKGGGEFFGKVGSFEPGYEFDAVVLDDSCLPHPQPLTVAQRLERFAYLSVDLMGVHAKFVAGTELF